MHASSDKDLDHLAALGRAWAAVRFLHPGLGLRGVDWVAYGHHQLDTLLSAPVPIPLDMALSGMLSGLDDAGTRILRGEPEAVPPPATQLLMPLGGNGAVLTARAARTQELDPGLSDELREAIQQAREKASTLVLDLRGAGWWFNRHLLGHMERLIRRPILLPAQLTRLESGYQSPEQPEQSGGMYRGSVIQHGERVQPSGGAARSPRIATLVDARSGLGLRLACALQRSRQGVIVFQGSELGVGPNVRVALAPNVVLRLRSAEWIHSDGTYGFAPNLTVDVRTAEDEVLQLAARCAARQGEPPDLPKGDLLGATNYESLPQGRGTLPDHPDRLLAVFELYGVIRYFEATRALSLSELDASLRASLRDALQATSPLAYAAALEALVRGLRDSHARVHSEALRCHVGEAYPPVAVRQVERRTVVVASAPPCDLLVGDVIVSVDAASIAARREAISAPLSHSTQQARLWSEDHELLAGPLGSEVSLSVEGRDGGPIRAPRMLRRQVAPRAGQVVAVLGDVLYVDLCRLDLATLPGTLLAAQQATGLILDLRGYCLSTVWAFARALADVDADVSVVERREIRTAGPATQSLQRMTTRLTPDRSFPAFAGPIALLIDERTISRSEYACQLFLAASRSCFTVGTPTSGTTGDLLQVQLPGEVTVCLSGQAYTVPGGGRIQGVGIQPDVEAHATIAGLRHGRDEILEVALCEFTARLDPRASR